MKQWTVYFRDKNGSKASVVIEAEDRSGVFAELKRRGISAISVSEGASNKKPRKAVSSGAPSKGRGLIVAAIVVLVAGIAAWWMWPEAEKPVEVKKEVKKSVKAEPVRPVKEKPVVKAEAKKEMETTVPAKPKFGRLPDGRWMVPGRKKIHNVVTNYSNVSREVPFRNATEQIMFQIFSRERGDMPLPLPLISERERKNLAAILMSKNPISDKDSEEMRLSKEIIEEAKSALRDYIKQGGDVDTFFTYYHNELQRSYETRKEAVRMVFEAARGEDRSVAVELCEKINEKLSQQGIKPVKIPRILLDKE